MRTPTTSGNAAARSCSSHEVTGFERKNGVTLLRTPATATCEARAVITCGGLYSDKIAQMTGGARDPKIVPFRGDYLVLSAEKNYLVQGQHLSCPRSRVSVPRRALHAAHGRLDLARSERRPRFRSRGLSLLRLQPARTVGRASPIPVSSSWRSSIGRSAPARCTATWCASAYVKALQRYIPELRPEDCLPGPSGVRAQAMSADGSLVDDFVFEGGEGVAARPQRSVACVRRRRSRSGSTSPTTRRGVSISALPRSRSHGPVRRRSLADGAPRTIRNLAIVDTRSTPHGAPGQTGPSGREQYASGHLPGAVFIDYAEDLHDLATPHAARDRTARTLRRCNR